MSGRAQAWLAWLLVAVDVAAGALVIALAPAVSVHLITELAASVLAGGVGALIVSRRAGNTIGWLLVVAGSNVLYQLADVYGYRGLVAAPGALPAAEWAAWLSTWVWIPSFNAGFVLLPLLFPTGRPPSPRWRPVLAFVVISLVIEIPLGMFRPGPLMLTDPLTGTDVMVATNPVGLPWLGNAAGTLDVVINVTFFPLLIALAASLVVRYRRAGGAERYQLRWLLLAVGLLPFAFALSALAGDNALLQTVAGVALMGVPASVGVAVLRYRLYELDRIISRTVAYAVVTAVVAGTYLAIAVVPSALLSVDSDLLVAAATLAAAAVFVPLRRRVQTAVDRRFNRARYDAAKVVERFGARLRDDLDVAHLGEDLGRVVTATVQPAHVSLWLMADRT